MAEITTEDRLTGIEHRILKAMHEIQTAHFLICQLRGKEVVHDESYPELFENIKDREDIEPEEEPCYE